MLDYHKAKFIRRGYNDSGMTVANLAHAYGVDVSTIYGVIWGHAHTEEKQSVYHEETCLSCPLATCVYDVQSWPNKDMLASCELEKVKGNS